MIVEPIGLVRSPYHRKYDAPRQPGIDDRIAEASIELFPHRNFEQAVRDLEGFERIWIIAWFDRATAWKPMVLPPRSAVKRGVFATRSPHRPNPIALSVARLLQCDGLRLTIAETDLLDGTPVLDIKPYLSYADAFVGSKAGWVDSEASGHGFEVVFSEDARIVVETDAALQAHVIRVLSFDPFPHPYRRTEHVSENNYILAVRSLRVHYTIESTRVVVLRIVVS